MREPPHPDAYGRVTNPERFIVVVEATEKLIDRLVETFEVERRVGVASVDFPDWSHGEGRTVRLVPSAGVALAFLFTDFPGVLVRFGAWGEATFPACGCDACGDQPHDVARRLTEMVETAVAGDYRESLSRTKLRYSFAREGSHMSSTTRLPRRSGKQRGERGHHQWPPWPRRQPSDR